MAQRSVTRDMPRLSLRAAFDPKTVDIEKRTVELTWTKGARVLRGGFFTEPYYEELSLDPKHVDMRRLRSGAAPVLNSHRTDNISDILGVVESASLDKTEGRAIVRFDSGPEGEDAFRRVREGTLRNVSVGYATRKLQKIDDASTSTPVFRAVDWEPHEVSLLPLGADAGAVTRSGGSSNPCEFIQENAMEPETTNTPAPPVAAAAPAALTAEQTRAAATAERDRLLGIQRRGAALGCPQTDIDEAIRAGTSLDMFTATAVDKRAATPSPIDRTPPAISPGEDARDKTVRGMSAWLVQRSGQLPLMVQAQKHIKESRPDLQRSFGPDVDLDPGEFRGMTMTDMARRCLEAANIRTSGMDRQQMVGKALTMREVAGSGIAATTGDFPNILENILYKVLLAQYMVTPDTWRIFCKVGSVSDFRVNKRYRMGTFGSLDALNEAGEFKNKSLPDAEKQSLTAGTKGNIIGISRQAIINDDMSAFDTLATMFGRAAALSIEVDVYALLALNAGLGPTMTDGLTLFHATHGNLTTGLALGAAAIDADRVAMASQKDPSNNEVLHLRPTTLVLPVGLGGTARQINNSQYDFDTSNKFQIANRVGGLFQQIVDTPRIAATRRYLFADPGVAPTIEVAFVDGQQQPFMDVQQGWRVDGVEWKVREDYGVAAIDFRGAVTNLGA